MSGGAISSPDEFVRLILIAGCQITATPDEQQQALNLLHSTSLYDGVTNVLCDMLTSPTTYPLSIGSRLFVFSLIKYIFKSRLITAAKLVNRGGSGGGGGVEDGSVAHLGQADIDKLKAVFMTPSLFADDKKITLQASIIAAKLYRYESSSVGAVADQWPELISLIVQLIQSDSALISERVWAVSVLKQCLEELNRPSERGKNSRYAFLCEQLYGIIWQSLRSSIPAMLQSQSTISADSNITFENLQNNLLISEYCNISSTIAGYIMTSLQSSASASKDEAMSVMMTEFVPALADLLEHGRIIKKNASALLVSEGESLDQFYRHATLQAQDELHPTIRSDQSTANQLLSAFHGAHKLFKTMFATPVSLLTKYPIDLVAYLETYLQFGFTQINKEIEACEFGIPLDDCLVTQWFKLVSHALNCPVYEPMEVDEKGKPFFKNVSIAKAIAEHALGADGVRHAQDVAARTRSTFFIDSGVSRILEFALSRTLRYNPTELEEWSDDPEAFAIFLNSEDMNESSRVASEVMVINLVDRFTDSIGGFLVQQMQQVDRQAMVLSNDPQISEDDIHYWDGIFLCVGYLGSYIPKMVDVGQWTAHLASLVRSVLIAPECGALKGGQQLLRARIIWLIKCYMKYFPPSDLLNLVVSILTNDSKNDVVSNFRTLELLQAMLEDCSGDGEYLDDATFAPYVVKITEFLCNYSGQLEEVENKSKVIEIIGTVIDRAKLYVGDMVEPLMEHLRLMWSEDLTQKLINIRILETVTKLVYAAKVASVQIHSVCLPLIHHSVVTLSKSAAFVDDNGERIDDNNVLYENGILLWLRICRNTSPENYSESLDSLSKGILSSIFESGSGNSGVDDLENTGHSDLFQSICMAVEALASIGGATCLSSMAAPLAKMFEVYLDNIPPRLHNFVLRPIEAFLMRCPMEITTFLLQSGIAAKIILICCSNIPELSSALDERPMEDRYVAGSNPPTYIDPVVGIVMMNNLSIVARLMLMYPEALQHACTSVISLLASKNITDAGLTADFIIVSLGNLIISHYDDLTDSAASASIWRKKMWCLSLWSLLPSTDVQVISMLPNLLVMTESALISLADEAEIQNGETIASSFLSVSLDDANFVDGGAVTVVDEAGKAMAQAVMLDVVHATDLKALVGQKLRELQGCIDEASFNQLYESFKSQIDYIMS